MRRSTCSWLLVTLVTTAAACSDGSPPVTDRKGGDPESPAAATTLPRLVYAPSAELQAASAGEVMVLWDTKGGHPRRIHGGFPSSETTPERAARTFLQRHAALFQLRADGRDLELYATKHGLAGAYLRFSQMASAGSHPAALPVFEGEV